MDHLNYDSELPVQYVPVQSITIPVTTTGNAPLSGDSLLCGWSFAETTGTAGATLVLWDGSDTTGQQIAFVNLAAGETTRDTLPFPGIYCTRGLFVQVVTGSVQGVVWTRDV